MKESLRKRINAKKARRKCQKCSLKCRHSGFHHNLLRHFAKKSVCAGPTFDGIMEKYRKQEERRLSLLCQKVEKEVSKTKEKLSYCESDICIHEESILFYKRMAVAFALVCIAFLFWAAIDLGPAKIIVASVALFFLMGNRQKYLMLREEIPYWEEKKEECKKHLRNCFDALERYNSREELCKD